MRNGLRACGADADAVFFDSKQAQSFPCPGVVLLSHGHYIVIASRKGDRLEVFDPQLGWSSVGRRKLARRCGGFGIQVNGLGAVAADAAAPGAAPAPLPMKTLLGRRTGRIAVAIFALAQLVTLALPLLSMWSVDRSVSQASLGLFGRSRSVSPLCR